MFASLIFHDNRLVWRPLLSALLACQLLLMVQLESANTIATPQPISLAAAIKQLEQTSPQLLLERALANRAQADRRQLQAELLPKLRLSGRQTRQRFGNPFAVMPGDKNPGNDFRSRLELTQVLFDIQKWSDFGKADTAFELAEWNVAILEQDLKQELIHLYYTYQKSRAEIGILDRNQQRAEELVRLARLRVNAGTATLLEQTRAEVRATNFNSARIDTELAAVEALSQIKLLLGMPIDQPLDLGSAAFEHIQNHIALPSWYESLQAVESLPEWRYQQGAVRRARIVARAATFKNLPTIEAFADWGYDSDQAFDGTESNGWMVGVSATIPLYEGGKLFAERKEAKAALAENLARLQHIEKGLQRSLYLADHAIKQRFLQFGIAQKALDLGQAEVMQANEEYQQGLVDNRALIDAQQSLADAELDALHAIYNFAVSRLALARSLGRVERVLE